MKLHPQPAYPKSNLAPDAASRRTRIQRILVTGGAGFIGSHTVDLLLRAEKQIVVLDNLSSGKIENLDLRHPNLEFIEGDVLEYPLLAELLIGCDAVLHLAAIASVQFSIENPIYSLQVNTEGTLHVLQAVYEARRPIRLVYASSAAVYGNTTELPCREGTRLLGLSPYALQKIHGEDYAALYARLHGLNSLALRYFNVYGSRQDPNSSYSGVISRFLNAYKNDTPLIIFGDGEQARDFIHVSDIAMANLLALQSDYVDVLNIATGKPQSLLDIIKFIEAAGKKTAKLNFEPARVGDIQSSYGSTELAEQFLNFRNVVSLEEGIELMVKSDI
jgi:nucleoside-diphosphate-sugar epimerase